MNKDRIAGAAKTTVGKIEKAAGKALGDTKMEADGKLKIIDGKIQNSIGGAKDTLREVGK